ncbi:MAG: hypothetical protein ACI4RL_01320 [Ruminococcus sp.]
MDEYHNGVVLILATNLNKLFHSVYVYVSRFLNTVFRINLVFIAVNQPEDKYS